MSELWNSATVDTRSLGLARALSLSKREKERDKSFGERKKK